jgi:hypothetical protein
MKQYPSLRSDVEKEKIEGWYGGISVVPCDDG